MFRIEFVGDFKNLKGRFAKADKELFDSQRESVRVLGRRWVQIARQEAPAGKKKDIRRKQTLRESIGYRTFTNGLGFTGYSRQPLGRYVVQGTAPHDIPREHYSKTLMFFWEKVGRFVIVPKDGDSISARPGTLVIRKGFVAHPGTKPNPFTERAATRLAVESEKELNRVAGEWIMTFGE